MKRTPSAGIVRRFTKGALWQFQHSSIADPQPRPAKSLVAALMAARDPLNSGSLAFAQGVVVRPKGEKSRFESRTVITGVTMVGVLQAFADVMLQAFLDDVKMVCADEVRVLRTARDLRLNNQSGLIDHIWFAGIVGEEAFRIMPQSLQNLVVHLEGVLSPNRLNRAQTAYGLWAQFPWLVSAEGEAIAVFEDLWFDTAESCLRRELQKILPGPEE